MSGFRLVLVGWGAIGARVGELLGPGVQIVGVALRDISRARDGLPEGAQLIDAPAQLAALRPDLVVEVAGRAAVLSWGMAALAAGADFAPASTSALLDADCLTALERAALASGRQVLICPGAIGGIDALAAAARLPLEHVTHDIIKPPAAWRGTEAETLCDLTGLTAAHVFFEGMADQAALRFPQNANVAAISALAGLGPVRTWVRLVADPGAARNRHSIRARGDFGTLSVDLENRPLHANPKSSELTALALLRLIRSRLPGLVI